MKYGEEIRRLREVAGIAQGALAAKLDLRSDELSRFETGNGGRDMTDVEFMQAKTALLALITERDDALEQARRELLGVKQELLGIDQAGAQA